MFQKELQHGRITAIVEKQRVSLVLDIDIGPGTYKSRHNFRKILAMCNRQRAVRSRKITIHFGTSQISNSLAASNNIHISFMFQQDIDHRFLTGTGSKHQRSLAGITLRIDICSGFKQHAHNAGIFLAVDTSKKQRSQPGGVFAVHVCPGLQQSLNNHLTIQ